MAGHGVESSNGEVLIAVSPQSEPLATTGVPFLHEEVAEVLSIDDGLSFDSETPFRWARVAPLKEPMKFKIGVDGEMYSHAVLTLWNWHNRPIWQWKVAANRETAVSLQVDGLGVYQFTLDGYRDDLCEKRLVRSVAVSEDLSSVRETWKTDEFFLGVCAFPGRYHWSFQGTPTLPAGLSEEEAREIEAELLGRLGFQVVRVDESKEMGDRLPRDKGGYRFQFDRMDAAVEAYTSRGFELAFQLMNAPDWAIAEKYAGEKENRWRYPRREDPQRAFIRALVERYGEHARFVQIFNEPDQVQFWSGESAEFVEQFRYSVEETHEVYPDMPIVNGGYALVDLDRTREFAKAFRGQLEAPAYHSHGDLPALREDFETITRIHRDVGYENPRFLNTEMGFDGWRLDQELSKGQIVPQKTLFCWASDHAGVLLFGGRMTLGPKRMKQDFGFLDHHFCPRYVYGSTAAFVQTLDGASFSRILYDDSETVLYQFCRGTETIIAGFTLAKAAEAGLQIEAERVIAIDEMGNRESLTSKGQVDWALNRYPRYLIVDKAALINFRFAKSLRKSQ